MSNRRPLVAGNWKMNLVGDQAAELVDGLLRQLQQKPLADVECLVCPSHVWLLPVAGQLADAGELVLGGQDVNEHDSGAHTGEVSASMLLDVGCRYVIIGHSERRQFYGDSHSRTLAKFVTAQKAGLRPVLCVGETEVDRESGRTEQVIAEQLDAVLAQATPEQWRDAVIAYEPVWAIGTGKTASPQDAQAVHAFIRSKLREFDATIAGLVRIVYGGSVKPENAASIFAGADVDGALVGGASLKADSFAAIARAASVN